MGETAHRQLDEAEDWEVLKLWESLAWTGVELRRKSYCCYLRPTILYEHYGHSKVDSWKPAESELFLVPGRWLLGGHQGQLAKSIEGSEGTAEAYTHLPRWEQACRGYRGCFGRRRRSGY